MPPRSAPFAGLDSWSHTTGCVVRVGAALEAGVNLDANDVDSLDSRG